MLTGYSKVLFVLALLAPTLCYSQTQIGGGGGGAGGGGAGTNAVNVLTTCGGTPNCFQVNANVLASYNATWTNASQTVTTIATDPAFVSATDVGKIEFGAGNCPGTVSNCTYNVPQGTISTVVSAHNVTVSVAATANSSGAVNTNNFLWGTDDGPTLVNAFAALFPNTFNQNQLQTQPQKNLYLPCGTMFTSVPPFITVTSQNQANGGGISGCGGAAGTVIVPLPKMNCNNATGGPAGGPGGCLFNNALFSLEGVGNNLPGWHLRDFTFWGGGTNIKDAAATYSNPATGITISFSDTLDNVWVIGWVWNQANTFGINNGGGFTTNSGSVAGGGTSCTNNANTVGAVSTWVGGSCGGSGNASFTVNNANVLVTTHGMYVNQVLGSGTGCLTATQVIAGFLSDFGSDMTTSFCTSGASAIAYLNGTRVNQNGTGNSALTIQNGIVHLNSVNIQATGAPINQTGGTIYDDCGNGVIPGTTPVITSLFGSCSVTGVADVTGNHVLTSGWGTSTVTASSGSVGDVFFTVNTTVGGAAGPVITDTFATPFWAAPKPGCTLSQVGGTFGVLSNPVASALSRTGVTWTFTGTPSINTYIFWRHCANS